MAVVATAFSLIFPMSAVASADGTTHRPAGMVWSWGHNESGQLGYDT